MKLKKLVFIPFMSLILLLSGCWSSHEINTMSISVCIGIDKTDNGYVVTEQVINPKTVASKKATYESPVFVYSAEGANIPEVITRMTTLISRKIYSSHLRMVIFSEELAKAGIADIIDYFLRYHEYRTDFYFAIAKGASAKEILSIQTPIESIPGVELFNKLKMSSEEWAPTKSIRIIELANSLSSDGINPTITAIEKLSQGSATDSTDELKNSANFEKLRFTDIGVFKKDKLVGWLNEDESKGFNYISNNVKHSSGFNADGNGIEVGTDVLKARSTVKAFLVNGQPQIDVNVEINYVITEVKGNIDVSKMDNLETINRLSETKITKMCKKAVEKAQEQKTDIFGFGEQLHTHYPLYWKTAKDNWNEIFSVIPVNIRVKAILLSTGDLTQSIVQPS